MNAVVDPAKVASTVTLPLLPHSGNNDGQISALANAIRESDLPRYRGPIAIDVTLAAEPPRCVEDMARVVLRAMQKCRAVPARELVHGVRVVIDPSIPAGRMFLSVQRAESRAGAAA